ncbi:MAG: hypothetical protein L3J71_01320 [Victivallaceae bacterium]|nr:hypothetical protein [Victivallaceae bacterium]
MKFFLILFFLCISQFIVDIEAATSDNKARLAPKNGGYFGLNLDWANDTPNKIYKRWGFSPRVYIRFFAFPMDEEDVKTLKRTAKLVKKHKAYLLVTLEPWDGLASITEGEADRHAEIFKKAGVRIFVRFAHEMNGSWYPWSQQPTEYKRAFKMMADALHRVAKSKAAMIWAPNYGGGYPFVGGQYGIKPGDPDFGVLDTNSDGKVDAYDDPYGPYYPGDDAVDWVAMTLYHWGSSYPWGENEIPEDGKFAAQLTGTYNGLNGDDSMIPDFYHIYAVDNEKPMAIPETAALFVPSIGTADLEDQIKKNWLNQVFSEESRTQFPMIKMINWFEWKKSESELGGTVVDWRISNKFDILESFIAVLKEADLGVELKD